MTKKSLSKIARDFNGYFTVKHREPNDDGIWILKDSAPEQYREIVRAAHGDRFPDDDVYGFVVSALDMIAESESNDGDEIRERFIEIEPDAYTGQLTAWLARNVNNVYYLTEALEEHDLDDGFRALAIAQTIHRQEVAEIVLSELQKIQTSL